MTKLFADAKSQQTLWRMRRLRNKVAKYSMGLGGVAVIIALVLIFVYLFYVVVPMFIPASIHKQQDYAVPDAAAGNTTALYVEEQVKVGARFTDQGKLVFFHAETGEVEVTETLVPAGARVTAYGEAYLASGYVTYGLADGRAVVARQKYKISYANDQKRVIPFIEYPFGKSAVQVDASGIPLKLVAFQPGEELSLLAAVTDDNRLQTVSYTREGSLLDEESTEFTTSVYEVGKINGNANYLLIDKQKDYIYVLTGSGDMYVYNLLNTETPELIQIIRVVRDKSNVVSMELLAGGISILIGDDKGRMSQWFPVRDENGNVQLTLIREFDKAKGSVQLIEAEQRRKSFITTDAAGYVSFYHATANRLVAQEKVSDNRITQIAMAPRSDAMLLEDEAGRIHLYEVDNEHPEVSWSSLWGEVWYESHEKPKYLWQSSSASTDFEPKFSLMPLTFGTLKAAFYAMLVAVPLAIMGAIYTAYFMSPTMRQLVKPTIEIMEALPTVILGFLAGLWLAPLVEIKLVGILALFIIMPLGIVLASFLWYHLPKRIHYIIPHGWDAALLVPVVVFLGWLSMALSAPLEQLFFGGDARLWLNNHGIGFDQRNSIVVGLAMGFAVIPTIFSITEDAIFGVPKHLSFGSLALGATPWQTLTRVVILTASPGIFSAVMIGLGRAVGETMIVLMATGNTPVMDMSIFQGMRTLSANIAVEMPESEVGSSHYRILFLAALVLFIITFVFNTAAEIVRHRLRKKYSSI
jgi:phosphate transport system permease protein